MYNLLFVIKDSSVLLPSFTLTTNPNKKQILVRYSYFHQLVQGKPITKADTDSVGVLLLT